MCGVCACCGGMGVDEVCVWGGGGGGGRVFGGCGVCGLEGLL